MAAQQRARRAKPRAELRVRLREGPQQQDKDSGAWLGEGASALTREACEIIGAQELHALLCLPPSMAVACASRHAGILPIAQRNPSCNRKAACRVGIHRDARSVMQTVEVKRF